MNAKNYLSQVRVLQAKLKAVDDTIGRLRKDLESLVNVDIRSSWPDGAPHGTIKTDPTGETASRFADKINVKRDKLREQLRDCEFAQLSIRSELWAKEVEILNVISEITDPVLFQVINLRYVEGKSFEWIAVQTNYSERHVFNLHDKALAEVQKILDEKK